MHRTAQDRTRLSRVTGLNYPTSVISAAEARTENKRYRLSFRTANFNTMKPSTETYNTVLSMDTLYWATDLEAVLSVLAESLASGGRMAIFMNHHVGVGEAAADLHAEH